jgi:type 1 glutamine amidotransferase
MSDLSRRDFLAGAAAFSDAARAAAATPGPRKRITFVAGVKTHGFGEHAHKAGCLFLAKCLNGSKAGLDAVVHQDGWPDDPAFFEGTNSIVLYMDGGDKHPILNHLNEVDALMKRGIGLAALHYSLVMPKGEPGDDFLRWIGGYYETYWSVNPEWTAHFDHLPRHAVTRGVRPFKIHDEWYYHMRFRDNMEGVTPILTAVPPDRTREGPDGPHSGNAAVRSRKGQPEQTAWVFDRPGGGRGFGFSGGHYHWGWANDDVRKLVLNAIAWTAGVQIPAGGIGSKTPAWEEQMANQEGQAPEGFGRETARQAVSPKE